MAIIKGKRAQTAVELAVFGAILVFVLGVTIRSAFTRGYQQQAALRATRMAMTQSYKTSASHKIASRNSASVLIVEDRLTSDSAKYGAVDRVPFMTQGSGVHSANLFMPVDFGDSEDLPVMDVYVNGKHFTFTMASFKTVQLAQSCNAPGGFCPGADLNPDDWEPNCVSYTKTTTKPCAGEFPCPAGCASCLAGSTDTYTETEVTGLGGCARLYTIVDNHPSDERWCDNDASCLAVPCSDSLESGCNLSVDERFDLDRDDVDGDGLDEVVTNPLERRGFAWQWYLVMGYDEARLKPSSFSASQLSGTPPAPGTVVSSAAAMAEGIIFLDPNCTEDCQEAKNVLVDVDRDLKMEYIMPGANRVRRGVIQQVGVRDPDGGDMDFTISDSDERNGKPRPGFTKDVNMYTFVRDAGDAGGTYLRIDEGKLFNGKQYIRTASKKDQIDVIERLFQLSNNTERFCMADGTRNPRGDNPVEVCVDGEGECYFSANIAKTCLDLNPDPDNDKMGPLLYIRSRPIDVHGRKWVTDVSDDPYVDFTGE